MMYIVNPTLNRFLVAVFCGSWFFGWIAFVLANAVTAWDYIPGTLMGIAILQACNAAWEPTEIES